MTTTTGSEEKKLVFQNLHHMRNLPWGIAADSIHFPSYLINTEGIIQTRSVMWPCGGKRILGYNPPPHHAVHVCSLVAIMDFLRMNYWKASDIINNDISIETYLLGLMLFGIFSMTRWLCRVSNHIHFNPASYFKSSASCCQIWWIIMQHWKSAKHKNRYSRYRKSFLLKFKLKAQAGHWPLFRWSSRLH